MIRLSLCIPTYNRSVYLRELLPRLLDEVAAVNSGHAQVELVVSDNASTDSTQEHLTSITYPWFRLFRNERNIGGDLNFLACVERSGGEYVWLFGDDELIRPGGVGRVLQVLTQQRPALLVLRDDGRGGQSCGETSVYDDYGSCLRAEGLAQFALKHTLITSNVFRRDCFDLDVARAMLRTSYAHVYGLLCRLRQGGRVVVASGVFRSREQRAQFARWPTALCVKQGVLLWRVANWFGVPQIKPFAVRLIANLPVEIAGCCLRKICPKYGRT